MQFYSDLTKQLYKTEEDLNTAESEYNKQAIEKEKKAEIRKGRAQEVEDAYKEVLDAEKNYHKLLKEFIKDYGSFHMTLHDTSDFVNDLFGLYRHFLDF